MEHPRLSFVIEWDNVRYYEIERAGVMLHRLMGQIRELSHPAEILLLFDAAEIDAAVVEGVVKNLRRDSVAEVAIRVIPTQGLRYYQLKNEGAKHATGDPIVFVDSDVIPEDGWLRHLVDSFRDPAVKVVIGNSYVTTDSLYGKAFALGWYYPERSKDGPLVVSRVLWVNNIAFRRSTLDRHPFPEGRDLYIQQTSIFADSLQADGVDIYLNPRAQVAHPPPRFFRSALIQGHDTAIMARRRNGRDLRFRRAYWGLRGSLSRACSRVVVRRHEVGLPAAGVPVALAIVSGYYALWCLAELLTHISPQFVRRVYAI